MIDIHPKVALLTAIRATDRPVAFLVGSALSIDSSGGVPGVADMLGFVRDEVAAKAPTECARYDTDLSGATDADKYQMAMLWLQGNLGQDAVNRVIERAILKARKSGATSQFVGDGTADDWMLPRGTQDLAKLIVTANEKFTGPILTTNFDPLLSLAIESCGGRVSIRVLDSDGSASRSVESRPGQAQIVHLHGYWRGSDTMHTAAQLTSPRPKLKASLQNLLRAHTLVVAAYAGWDDVFTEALAGILDDDEAKVNILWCFYESDPSAIATRYARLISRLQPAIRRGRFLAYGGIDCHSVFSELCAPCNTTVTAAKAAARSPISGWEIVDPVYLASLKPLGNEEVIRYFDGAMPTWRHAVSDAIPRREVAKTLAKWPAQLANLDDHGSMQLITAAGGEGKTTVLLQAAADFVRAGEWTVLWRASPDAKLSPIDLAKLRADTQWLIVADDAEGAARDLAACARYMHERGQANVDFLLAARDTDWRAARAHEATWSQWLKVQPEITLRHIGAEDAQAIVDAWGRCGPKGLGLLANIDDPEARTAAFLRASKDADTRRGDGYLFGGLLAVRFDDAGLLTHVRQLLVHLRRITIEGSEDTLFDAAVYIAACHAVGIPGIHEAVLADLLSVPQERIHTRVVRPLGEESVAVKSAGCIFTRHTRVAMAIVTEAYCTFGIDLAEIWSILVRQTVKTDREQRLPMYWFSKMVHAGPRLVEELPKSIPKSDRAAAGLSAARAAMECKPEWLGCVVGLGNAYRLDDQHGEAIKLFRAQLKAAPDKVDYQDVIRGFWCEWGVSEGAAEKIGENLGASAWIQGLSMSDQLRPISVTMEHAKRNFAGLGVAFGRLANLQPSCPFALARRAVAFLGRLTGNDRRAQHYYDKYNREADLMGTPRPRDIEEAIGWLAAGTASAGRLVEDPFLKGLADPNRITFEMLQRLLAAN